MDASATLVWMAPEAPDAAESRALSSWSHAHGVRLVPPPHAASPAIAVDTRLADGVEPLLEQARDAIAARDGDSADQALSSAESTLRAHPELPQASWLMAEVQRARAARWRRVPPIDTQVAEGAWLRAEALDGGRVPGVAEEGSARHPSPATVALDLTPDDAQAWLDGEPVRAGAIATHAGPHSLIVTSEGAPVWAAWIETLPGSSTLHVSAPSAPACSDDDVARARMTPDAIDASHVRCGAWVAAVGGAQKGGVRVAVCEANRCGSVLEWREPTPWTSSPMSEPGRDPRWPAWATWSLLGTAAVIGAGAVIFATGVLQPAPTETRFVSGGIKTQ
jgi:hypothetical protein